MVSKHTVYHVVPNVNKSKWLVVQESNEKSIEEFDTREAAEEAAITRAQREKPSQLKVHRENGSVDYESIYGDDPPGSLN